MKWIFLLIFISVNAWSADRLQLVFDESEVKQGALIKARLFVPASSINVPVQKLKGENIAETIFFQQISPLFRKEGSEAYTSDVVIIFTKVPESNMVTAKVGNQEFELQWNELKVDPVEATGQMLWADFTAPDFFEKSLTWILWIVGVLLIAAGGFFLGRRFSKKAKEQKRRRLLAQEVRSCQNYEDVVNFWKKKRNYLRDFPHLEETFPALENTLFKYSFKPSQTETEKEEVLRAYKKMMEASEGGFRGI